MKVTQCVFMMFSALGAFFGFMCGSSISYDGFHLVKDALIRRMCYDDYWRGRTFLPGGVVSINVKFTDDKFAILANGVLSTGDGYAFFFYDGRIKGAKASITNMIGFTTDLSGKGNPSPLLEMRRNEFASGKVYEASIDMPTDCTPQYEPATEQKELMTRAIVRTVRPLLIPENNQNTIAAKCTEFTIIIADFNIDYPYTYVIVEPTMDILLITLHDQSEYDNEVHSRYGEYPFTEVKDMQYETIRRIREHGIIRKLTINK